ncbi:site-specific integrase [Ectopseudomonas oleovorans]|uniref:site-specific integrase n=1 Tax=Ectopseudomonas oleovorans TaxID=301 RepID=UPI000CF06BEF|nr:site-specific integrase [Pseudomonas oleovorans]PPV33825.1 integrase [Pseudomonas oleovorans]
MPYVNPLHSGRMVLVPRVRNAFAELHVSSSPRGAIETQLEGVDPPISLYQVNELSSHLGEGDVYNFPFLFHRDGIPWNEANSYLLNLVRHKPLAGRPTDEIRRRAGKLLDYLMFCEDHKLDWLDFSAKRPALRPTYKYFEHLGHLSGRSSAVVNQYTGVVYDFYKFVAANRHDFDISRVDTVKEIKLLIEGVSGRKLITVEKRGQTKATPPVSSVEIGFVREDGEDLRPLTNLELGELMKSLESGGWSPQDRLILFSSMMTGARKQTVLTLRMKHLKLFDERRILSDGTYLLHAGPGTGIDTKRNQPQQLYFPKQLAEELIVWANSPTAKARRRAFQDKFNKLQLGVPSFVEGDHYVFLSDQGGCYYMAQDDPRYPIVSSRPTGQVADTLKKRILGKVSDKFSRGFTYHWLRATYAFQLYQRLLPLLASGEIQPGEEITMIQRRMHHKHRETTEQYLKLFRMHSQKLEAQEVYEKYLFGFSSYQDLKVEMGSE